MYSAKNPAHDWMADSVKCDCKGSSLGYKIHTFCSNGCTPISSHFSSFLSSFLSSCLQRDMATMSPPSSTHLTPSSTLPNTDPLPATSHGRNASSTNAIDSLSNNNNSPHRILVEPRSPLWFVPDDIQLPPRLQIGPTHSKRQPSSHTPRPRNPFILLRSHLLHMGLIPANIKFCGDNRQVSRITSFVWSVFPERETEIFYNLAEEEKEIHKTRYPNYKISPRDPNKKPVRQQVDEADLNVEGMVCIRIAAVILSSLPGENLRPRIQEIVEDPIYSVANHTPETTPSPLPQTLKPISPRRFAQTHVPMTPTSPKYRATKIASPRSTRHKQAKHRSSSSEKYTGKGTLLTTIYARRCNPSRNKAQVSYIECDSSDIDELASDSENASLMSEVHISF
jgi:hypothetical protein